MPGIASIQPKQKLNKKHIPETSLNNLHHILVAKTKTVTTVLVIADLYRPGK